MGLDFDVQKKGLMSLSITPDVPASNAQVLVELRYCDPVNNPGLGLCQLNQTTGGGGTCHQSYSQVIASGKSGGSLANGAPANFQVEMAIDPKYDLIQYKLGVNLGLCVKLITTDVPENVFGANPLPSPEFDPKKARLRLPLLEYHDPVDQAFTNVGVLGLTALTPFEKKVNPGRTSVFKFELSSNASSQRAAQVDVQGIHAEWAELTTGRAVVLEPGTKQLIEIAVRVPEDAGAGETAELFITAQDRTDAAVVTVSRFRATVVDKSTLDVPDETPEGVAQEKDDGGFLPGFEVAAILAAATVALAWRRRRA